MSFLSALWMSLCIVVFGASIVIIFSCGFHNPLHTLLAAIAAIIFNPFSAYKRLEKNIFQKERAKRKQREARRPHTPPPPKTEVIRQSTPSPSSGITPSPPIPARVSIIPDAVFAPLTDDGRVDVPARAAGLPIAYHYDTVGIYTPKELDIDVTKIDPGLRTSFRFEPSNTYDKDAVAVYAGSWKIGYMYRGRLRDMLVDWAYRQQPIWSHIASVDDEQREIKIAIVFYKERPKRKIEDDYDFDDEDEDFF